MSSAECYAVSALVCENVCGLFAGAGFRGTTELTVVSGTGTFGATVLSQKFKKWTIENNAGSRTSDCNE